MRTLTKATAVLAVVLTAALSGAQAAPSAALVMDARTGEVLHSRSGDRRLHPASLTKMMTLYLAFEAVRDGRLSLDQRVRVSRNAARQVPSRIGLSTGQRVSIRDMIRATAVKSANDAAVVLADAIAGDEASFARMMTARAQRLGMSNTTFRNASGLTAEGQLSTARDMATLGRALFYHFPEYYNLFGRKTTRAVGVTLRSTNRRLLQNYRGADGIKTGYTNAAGYNLVSSAERGDERVIAVVFGGKTSSQRNAKIAELLDMGFARAPSHARVRMPSYGIANVSPLPLARPGSTVSPSLLARAGSLIAPAAHAAETPVVYTAHSPRTAPMPLQRPGSETVLAQATPAVDETTLAPTPRPSPSTAAATAAAASRENWAVQLGVFSREETAIAELTSAALSDVNGLNSAGREIRRTTLSGASVFRARLTGFDQHAAEDACDALKARGMPCLPVKTPID